MRYWHRPKFWLLLLLDEAGAFLLSAALATGFAAVLVLLGVQQRHMGTVVEIAGPLINAFLAYSAFCDVRNRASRWPQSPRHDFPVILAADQKAG
jgi:hypothetical protein